MWDRSKLGQLIRLDALVACRRLREPGARLPNWKQINTHFPELVYRWPTPVRNAYFVSHRWDGIDHPDPTGWQLKALIRFAEACMGSLGEQDACIWLDYMSLPQKPRTADEDVIFRSGLENIRAILARSKHALLISETGNSAADDSDAMQRRGWIVFELFLARQRKMASRVMWQRHSTAVNFAEDEPSLDYAIDLPSVLAIDTPALIHAWFEKQQIVCTNGSDLLYLATLLHEELTKYDYGVPPPGIVFGQQMTISNKEMIKYAIRESSNLSSRFPNIYLSAFEFHRMTVDTGPSWTVTFVHRPPLPSLGTWVVSSEEDRTAMRIHPGTGASPMYPGIIFEFDSKERRMRASLA